MSCRKCNENLERSNCITNVTNNSISHIERPVRMIFSLLFLTLLNSIEKSIYFLHYLSNLFTNCSQKSQLFDQMQKISKGGTKLFSHVDSQSAIIMNHHVTLNVEEPLIQTFDLSGSYVKYVHQKLECPLSHGGRT